MHYFDGVFVAIACVTWLPVSSCTLDGSVAYADSDSDEYDEHENAKRIKSILTFLFYFL